MEPLILPLASVAGAPNEASLASEQRDESLGLGGTLEKFVDHGLVGLLTAARETAKARESRGSMRIAMSCFA